MSGHSKWSSIKHKKAATDAKKGKIFTKIIREITMAARSGGGDPEMNPRLRTAIAAAKTANMPNDNIDKGIQKGTGELEGVTYEEITYEGYGPAGVAILIETATDNKNRTVADIRHILGKHSGSLGATGSVSWMFESRGLIVVSKEAVEEDKLMELVLELGATDFESEDEDVYSVYTEANTLEDLREGLEKVEIKILSAELIMHPKTTVKLTDHDAEKMLKLMDKLEDSDDVQNVHANFDIDDEEIQKIMG